MRYTVYFDHRTRKEYVMSNGIMWRVSSRTTIESCPKRRTLVDLGVLIPGCEVITWHRQCSGPNGWGEYDTSDEARAAEAYASFPLSGEPAACKTTKAVV